MALTLAAGALTRSARDAIATPPSKDLDVRFATFNASLNRNAAGDLVRDLSTGSNAQARTVAEIIQRVNPDVLLINEFDYVEGGRAAELFRDNYLRVGQNGAASVEYPYFFTAPVNTGVPSGFDLNNGVIGGGDDAFGFGLFPGQYGMVVYSKHPIDEGAIR
ncbi:MAG TPA: endonuclease/exonuclease/phosphatase family protein, partial [Actinomycetota bacterium]|nr:endonuclease/exonuclease/phosphatase family protein [Actinomycetota bacterium]